MYSEFFAGRSGNMTPW